MRTIHAKGQSRRCNRNRYPSENYRRKAWEQKASEGTFGLVLLIFALLALALV